MKLGLVLLLAACGGGQAIDSDSAPAELDTADTADTASYDTANDDTGDADCVPVVPESAFSSNATASVWGDVAYESFGASAAAVGDVDGDGRSEVVAGAPGWDSYVGGVAILSGATIVGEEYLDSEPYAWISSDYGVEWLGMMVLAGDDDGDGDLEILAAGNDYASVTTLYAFEDVVGDVPFSAASGRVWLDNGVFTPESARGDSDGDGNDDVWLSYWKESEEVGFALLDQVVDRVGILSEVTDAGVVSEASDLAQLGSTIAVGDRNGDGFADIAVSGIQLGTGNGVFSLFDAPLSGTSAPNDGGVWLTAEDGVATLDAVWLDYDGDGNEDLAIGQSEADAPGSVAVLHGPLDADQDLAAAAVVLYTPDPYEATGMGLTAGDLDGDCIDDLVVTAYLPYGMAVFVTPGGTGEEGVLALHERAVHIDIARPWVGTSIGGDVDGDGIFDLVLDRQLDPHNGAVNAGGLDLFAGGSL